MEASAQDATRYGELFRRGMSDTHRRTVEWVPRGARVLELGCASGDLGLLLTAEKGCRVLGAEVDAAAADEARARGLEIAQGSLEDAGFLDALVARGPFDVVIANDVIEHLRDPEPTVAALARMVGPRGQAILAVPNVATWSMRWKLLTTGAWEYEDTGLLDRTHLRFFTWDSLHALVERQGWRVIDRVIDGYEIPFGKRILGDLVEGLRERVTGWPSMPEGPARLAVYHANQFFDGLIRKRQRLHRRLLRHVPNLVAPHIGLLLERARP